MCCVLPPSFQGNKAVADILNAFCLMPQRYAIISVSSMSGGDGGGGGGGCLGEGGDKLRFMIIKIVCCRPLYGKIYRNLRDFSHSFEHNNGKPTSRTMYLLIRLVNIFL